MPLSGDGKELMNTSLPEYVDLNHESFIDLRTRHTMALQSAAAFVCDAYTVEQIEDAWQWGQNNGVPVWVLGDGSNTLFPERFKGLVLAIKNQGITVKSQTDDAVYVTVAAGEHWDTFLQHCIAKRWYGVENMALIPGTVGASPVQNIGAYGQEVADVIDTVHAFNTQTGCHERLTHDQCGFGYRDSRFKQEHHWIITAVTFRLPTQFKPVLSHLPAYWYDGEHKRRTAEVLTAHCQAADVRQCIVHIRQQKLPDPHRTPNAGSFFKNPCVMVSDFNQLQSQWADIPYYPQADGSIKIAAAWLIEQAGWRGQSLGHVGMYSKQALVMVNHGKADLNAVIALRDAIVNDIHQLFGISLEQEPVIAQGHL